MTGAKSCFNVDPEKTHLDVLDFQLIFPANKTKENVWQEKKAFYFITHFHIPAVQQEV